MMYGRYTSLVNMVAVPIIFPEAELMVAATTAARMIPATAAGAKRMVASARAFFWGPAAYPSIQV